MLQFLIGVVVLFASASVSAAEFGHTDKDRKQINTAFNAMADRCANDFGFTRIAKKPDAVLVDKMQAYLLLATSYDLVVRDWAQIAHDSGAMDRAEKDDALAERLADALIAAEKDRDSYASAEALWVRTFKAPVQTVAGACRAMTADAFLSAHYLTGAGSADVFDEKLKQMFADNVKAVRQ